jgi:hypothetical protein
MKQWIVAFELTALLQLPAAATELKPGCAPPPARLYHFQPLDLGTALITVHKDSSQQRASPDKAAFSGGISLRHADGH